MKPGTRSNILNMPYEKPKFMSIEQMFDFNYSLRDRGTDSDNDSEDSKSSFDFNARGDNIFTEDEEEGDIMGVEPPTPIVSGTEVFTQVDPKDLQSKIINAVNAIDIYEIFQTPKSSSKLLAEISHQVLSIFNKSPLELIPEKVMLNEQLKRKAQLYLLPDNNELFATYGDLGETGFNILKDYLASKYQYSDLIREKTKLVQIWENKSFMDPAPYLWWWSLFCTNVVFHIFCLEVNVHLIRQLKSPQDVSLDDAYDIVRNKSLQNESDTDPDVESNGLPSKRRKQN
ncbi:uncharacterized protein SAPINGB_P001985 [Magnusiomyces paraingens]|uniref:Uncharacterized protein n=1 Tax=Magnusiomyces paraingens TaxID=2606893 RepID=A0A5E8BJK8_9ASCO|nr:uncharacterized protein SAPINGB_P001985 [Saprochaete ingens]VVT48857.1 unnamed protein product [Saprochaete ingens]